jgi:ubiquinone/menaquinone biosynthesis C-methylase UbiE
VTGDATSLEFADASFDTVVSFETIEHLTDVAAYLDEVCRVLKPGGSFLVSTPNRRLAFANPFHTVEFTFRQFRKVISDRFADVRFLGQDHLPFSRKLLLEVSVKVSRTLPESIKQHIIPERSRVDDDSRKVAGIVDSQVSSCRFFLALCRK